MVKSDLVEALRVDNPKLHPNEIRNIVDLFFEDILQALADGRRVELRGFGVFSVRSYLSRQGRNPRTGAAVPVEAKSRVHFRTGKEMRARLTAKKDKSA